MRINPFQAALATVAIATTAVLAEVLAPRELMARSTATLNLEQVIPQKFGDWTFNPGVGVVTPTEPPDFVEPDANSSRIYAKELGRGYTDRYGNLVMLLIAYGPVQNHRLKAHRPEFCYAANGFLVSQKTSSEVAYNKSAAPLKLTRLITERDKRFEPVSYWLRTGNEVATGIVDQQIIRLRYGLRGIIPDGALVRVSTIGVSADASFKLQDQFLRELLAAVTPETRKFLIGR
jgi:EpsI family protein